MPQYSSRHFLSFFCLGGQTRADRKITETPEKAEMFRNSSGKKGMHWLYENSGRLGLCWLPIRKREKGCAGCIWTTGCDDGSGWRKEKERERMEKVKIKLGIFPEKSTMSRIIYG
jgi:hypothetical protein